MDEMKETGCCSRFNPKPWDEKEVTWKDKLFVKDRVTSVFHIPLNFGQVMARNTKKIDEAGASLPEALVFTEESSLWGADIYIAVSKEVPGAEIVKISGTFLTKVFEGSYKDIRNWIKEMEEFVKSKDKKTKKLYFWYTTCPACAKAYGKNYVVLVAEV